MTIANYTDLIGKPGAWLRRSDLNSVAPDFVTLAEAEMNRQLATANQLVSMAYAITGEFVAKPTGMRQLRTIRLTSGTGREVRKITPEEMTERKAVPTPLMGEPREYTAIGLQLEFYPVPNTAYQAVVEMQTGFEPLSADNPTNWILTDHPDAYLWGVLAAACAYLKQDERAQGFEAKFEQVLADVNRALRTTYDRRLRVDPAIQARPRGGRFNIFSGGYR
jgi:hypothetical protein